MLTRRALIRASGFLAAPTLLPRALRAYAVGARSSALHAFVGTYTPNGGGIYLFRIDGETGALTQLQIVDDIRNPSWLAINANNTRLYAVSEIDTYQGARGGAVAAYAIDPETMQLRRLGAVNSGGAAPAHLSIHPSGKFVFVANYGGGSVAVSSQQGASQSIPSHATTFVATSAKLQRPIGGRVRPGQ